MFRFYRLRSDPVFVANKKQEGNEVCPQMPRPWKEMSNTLTKNEGITAGVGNGLSGTGTDDTEKESVLTATGWRGLRPL